MKFNYDFKTRDDFLKDIVKPMVKRRKNLQMTQEHLDFTLGVAHRLVSKWECGNRTPLSFHLYCWADALDGRIVFLPNEYRLIERSGILCLKEINPVNDNQEILEANKPIL